MEITGGPQLGLTDLLGGGCAANTDRELWREGDDYYADSIHVTASGGIGINVGGLVIVRPLREWHAAMLRKPMTAEEADAAYDDAPAIPMTDEEIQAIVDKVTGCPICGGTLFDDPLPGTHGRRCVHCCVL